MPVRSLARWALLLALLTGFGGTAVAQQAPVPGQAQEQRPGQDQPAAAAAPMTALIDQLTGLFPTVDGEVLEVQGDTVTFDVGRSNGVVPGLELDAYREGREIKHPKTGQVLGRTEETLGRIRVTQAQERLSTARAPAGHGIKVGDRVRVSSGRVNLVLVPLQGGMRDNLVEVATQDLVERLSASGRFRVTMGDSVNVVLAQQGIKPEEFLDGKGVADAFRHLRTDNILAVLFKRVQGRPFMDVRFFWPGQPGPMIQSAFFVPPAIRSQAQTARFSQGGPNNPAQVRSRSLLERLLGLNFDGDSYSAGESSLPLREAARFSFPVLALDVAVQPNDKVPRMVVSDGDQVYMYRIVDQNFQTEWTRSVRSLGRVFSLQLADLDRDGVLEVIGNRYDPKLGLNNFVLAYKNGQPRFMIDHVPDFLFAVDATGQGVKQTLWTQRYHPQEFFTPGQADQVSVKNGRLVTEKRIRVPQSFRPMGAAFSNITGKGTWSLAYVDSYNRLQLANDAEELWRSGTPVGGGYMLVEQVLDGTERGGRSRFHKIEPTPLAVDLDNDGIDELVVPQNIVREGLLAVIFKGPAGYRLQSVESGFAGGMTAIGAYRAEEAVHPTLVVAVVRFSNMLRTSGVTQIIMTVPQE